MTLLPTPQSTATISRPISRAFRTRAGAVRAFRRACEEAYRATQDDRFIRGRWVLPSYLEG